MKPLYDNTNVNWTTQIQVEFNGAWHDVIFSKSYLCNKVILIYEYCGVPTTIYALIDEVKVRNKPVVHKKTLYLILFKSGACSVYSGKEERDKHVSELCNYELRDIDLEWET